MGGIFMILHAIRVLENIYISMNLTQVNVVFIAV